MMADPLHAPIVGLPDRNDRPTLISRIRDVYDVIPSATSAHLSIFGSLPTLNSVKATETSGAPSAAAPLANSSFQTSIVADSSVIRVLAFVVQWQPTQSMMNNSGRVFLGLFNPNSTGIGSVPMQPYASYFDDDGESYPASQPASIIVRVSQDGNIFVEPGNTGPTGATAPFAVAVFTGLTGTAPVGELIVTRIVEAVPQGNTLSYSRAKHTPCDMTDCCVAANIVGNTVRTHGGDDTYESLVKKSRQLASAALRMYTAYTSGGASELANLIGG